MFKDARWYRSIFITAWTTAILMMTREYWIVYLKLVCHRLSIPVFLRSLSLSETFQWGFKWNKIKRVKYMQVHEKKIRKFKHSTLRQHTRLSSLLIIRIIWCRRWKSLTTPQFKWKTLENLNMVMTFHDERMNCLSNM